MNKLFHQKFSFEKIIPGLVLQIAQHMPAGILTRCSMCVTNPNQGKLVARIFFLEQNKLSTFGQNSPSLIRNYFLCKIKAERVPITYSTAQHINMCLVLLHYSSF